MTPAVLLYDDTCRFCRAGARRALSVVPPGRVALRDVNDAEVQARYGITPEQARREMYLVLPSGRISSGAYAVRDLLRLSKWAWPAANLWRVPGVPWLANRVYAWVAAHRYLFMGRNVPGPDGCEDGACDVYLGRGREGIMKE